MCLIGNGLVSVNSQSLPEPMTTKTYDATKCSYTASEKVWRTKTLEASVNCFSVVKSFCDTVALSAKFQNGLTTKIDVIDKQPTTHHPPPPLPPPPKWRQNYSQKLSEQFSHWKLVSFHWDMCPWVWRMSWTTPSPQPLSKLILILFSDAYMQHIFGWKKGVGWGSSWFVWWYYEGRFET